VKPFFLQHTDLFIPVLAVSFSIHVAILSVGTLMPESPQVSIVEAPSSVEVTLIEKQSVKEEDLVEEIVEETVEDVEDAAEEPVEEILEKVVEKAVEKVVEKGVEQEEVFIQKVGPPEEVVVEEKREIKIVSKIETVKSLEVQGTQIKAQPLEHINPAPVYPRRAQRRGWEGVVVLKVLVEKDGTVSQVNVEESSGYAILDHEALRTVRLWKFAPAQTGMLKFASWITLPIQFSLIENF